jgi:hypothetical protein
MSFRKIAPALSFCALSVTTVASAQYAVNTLGAQTFTTGGGLAIAGADAPNFGAGQAVGFQFTSAAGGELNNVTVSIVNESGANAPTLVALYSDNAGEFGTVLESWDTGPAPGESGGGPLTVLSNSLPSVDLAVGQKYWVVLTATGNDTDDAWNTTGTNSLGISESAISQNVGANWTYYPLGTNSPAGFSVTVSPLVSPEPSSLVGLCLGALGLLVGRRRRQG